MEELAAIQALDLQILCLTTQYLNHGPLGEILLKENAKKIINLQESLKDRKDEIHRHSQDAREQYGKYLSTDVPVCQGASGYSAGGAWSAIKTLVGSDHFQRCVNNRTKLQETFSQGVQSFTKMVMAKEQLYATYSTLLTWAPSQEAWRDLCSKKRDVDKEFEALTNENVKIGQQAHTKKMDEDADQAAATVGMNSFVNALASFLAVLQKLIEAVGIIFQKVIEGLSWFTKFAAQNPKVLWIGGGALVLGVGAFVLRPYISIASTAIGIGRGD